MPGIGPLTALAEEAFTRDMASFRCGGFRCVAGTGTTPVFFGRQGALRAGVQGRAG